MRLAWVLLLAAACGDRQDAPDGGHFDAGPSDGGLAYDSGIEPDGPIRGEVSILSWNIETYPKTATTARLVKETIEMIRPDLVGVQEIAEEAAFEALIDSLPDYGGVQVSDPRNFLRVGLLYREERVEISEVFALFEDDGYAFPRPPLKADVTITSTSGPLFDFVFVTVHHKARGDTESRERRRAANVALDSWVRAEMETEPERDFVIVGDFNDRLEDGPGENVFAPFLEHPELYNFLTRPLLDRGEVSYLPFPGLIDHVLVTTDALVEYGDGTTEALRLEETLPRYETNVSDHRPILSRFRIRSAGQ